MALVDTSKATVATETPADEPRPRRHLVFAVVSIALFMASVDQTIVATALGTLQRDLHAQVNWSSWTITVYALGQILVKPVAGRISDQYGRKRVFLCAIVLFTVCSLCCGLAGDIYILVGLRAVQALGGGAFMPSATGIVSDAFGRDRDRAIGLFASIFPIGALVGPVLGGLFVTYWSWRGIFLVNVPIGIVVFCLALAVLPASAKQARERLDVAGIALLGAGLLGVMLGVSSLGAGSESLVAAQFVAPLVVGLAALALFARHSARAAHPFIPVRLLRGRGFAIMNLINFCYGVALLGFSTLVPLYAQNRYGLNSLSAGTLLTARAVGMIGISALAVFALRRTGYRPPMIVGYLLAAAGLVLLAVPPPGLSPYLWLSIAAAVTGIGLGAATPASNNAVLHLEPDSVAAVAGLRGTFRQSGGIIGIAVVTAILARSSTPGLAQADVFVVFGALLVCSIPLVFRVPEHRGRW